MIFVIPPVYNYSSLCGLSDGGGGENLLEGVVLLAPHFTDLTTGVVRGSREVGISGGMQV